MTSHPVLSEINDPGQVRLLVFPVNINILTVSNTKEDLGFWFQERIMVNIKTQHTILRVALSHSSVQSFPPSCSVFSQAMSTLESGQKHSSGFLSDLRNFRVLSVMISNKVRDKVNISLHFFIFIYLIEWGQCQYCGPSYPFTDSDLLHFFCSSCSLL